MGHIPTYNKKIALADKLAVAERELSKRRQFYPGWVTGVNRKLTPEEAAFQIAAMEEIAADYRRLLSQNTGEQQTIF